VRAHETPLGGIGLVGEAITPVRTPGRVVVCGRFGFDAPVAEIVLGHFWPWRSRRRVDGCAGGLQPDRRIGDVVLRGAVVRDEGWPTTTDRKTHWPTRRRN
jgi:hypothetical protein